MTAIGLCIKWRPSRGLGIVRVDDREVTYSADAVRLAGRRREVARRGDSVEVEFGADGRVVAVTKCLDDGARAEQARIVRAGWPKVVRCLRCSRLFRSPNPAVRMCNQCRDRSLVVALGAMPGIERADAWP